LKVTGSVGQKSQTYLHYCDHVSWKIMQLPISH